MSLGAINADYIQSANNIFSIDNLIQKFNSTPTVTTLNPLRNKIINGAMTIWQRGINFTSNGYSADKWQLYANSGTICYRSTDVPNSNFLYSISMSGTGTPHIYQSIESSNARDLIGKNITVSFWAKTTSGSGNISVAISYANAIDNFSSITIIATAAAGPPSSTWTYYTATFSNLPSGVSNGLRVNLYLNTTGAGTVLFTGVQLEEGSIATGFEYRPVGFELLACQRYYYQITSSVGYLFITYTANGDSRGLVNHPVVMRTVPSMSFSPTSWYSHAQGQTATNNVTIGVTPAIITSTSWVVNTDTSMSTYGSVNLWASQSQFTVYASADL